MKMKRGRSCVLSQWGTLPLTILFPSSLALILYFLVQPGKGQEQEACPFSFLSKCDNGKCITKRFECNERNDCGDGSDEMNCFSSKPCASDQFRCETSGKCIPGQYRCDKKQDCLDGSDEKECSCSWSNTMFNCTSDPYYCIQDIFECDGHEDCPHGSDEKNCRARCSDNAFSCDKDKGTCVLQNRYCEKKQDCPSVPDKKECERSNCSDSQFACRTGECIQGNLKCNKVMNCKDWSDEENCDNCAETEFACTIGGCLTRDKLCNGFPDCADKSDEINCNKDGAPNQWLGKSLQHPHQNSTLTFADGNVVVYYEKFKSVITWFHDDLSKAWQYVKEMYGIFGDDPRLYVILRYETLNDYTYPKEKDSVCESTLYNNDTFNGRNVILCYTKRPTGSAWSTPDTFSKFQLLFSSIGDLIVKELRNNHRALFSDVISGIEKYLSYLIFYDIFINLRGNTQDIQDWYNKVIQNQTETTDSIDLFHHSIFPHFYAENGLAPVLSNFNILLKIYKPNFSTRELFMHFMSGAAGTDLLSEYSYEFNQSYSSNEEFDIALNSFTTGLTNAASTFPFVTYKIPEDSNIMKVPPRNWRKRWRGQDEHLTFAYSNSSERVAFYFKNFRLYFYEDAFGKISKVWKFITENQNYGLNSTKPFLSVVLSDVNITVPGDGGWGCLSSNDLKIEDTDFDSRHVIECGPSAHLKWSNSTPKNYLDDIVVHMARLTLKLNGGAGNWAARNVSAWTMESILVYDIYKSLGKTFGVELWETAQEGNAETFPMAKTYWYRDWYRSIYKKYNGSEAIRNFLSLVQKYWPTDDERNHARQMNTGEFIYFWSAAVNQSLLLAYKQDIWRNSGDVIGHEICGAIQAYPEVSYPNRKEECTMIAQGAPFWIIYALGGGAAGVLLLIMIGFGIKFGMYRKRLLKMSNYIRNLTKEEMSEFYQGNPNLSKKDAHAAIDQLPFNDVYEVPRERLIIEDSKLLGAGEFGVVKQGILKGAPDSGMPDVDVAVKMVKKNVEVLYFKAMLTEIKIMAHMGKHDHIASLLATVTKNIINCEVYVAIEFCARGDLHGYLMSNADKFKDLFSTESSETSSNYSNFKGPQQSKKPLKIANKTSANFKKAVSISTLDLLEWTRQMAVGMHFLDTKNVIHGDLAARNVLITDNNVAKISDFGLSRQLVNYSNYLKKSQTPLPWRWLAIESLTSMSFSVHSDIWAYGVTMWEIFSLGKVPYPGRTWDHEFVDELTAGVRLPKPEFGNHEVYTVMLDCMRKVPDERIGFPQIASKLERIIKSLGGICAIPSTSTSTSTSTPGPSSSNVPDLPLPPPPEDWNNPLPTPPKPPNTLPTPPKPSNAVPTPPKPKNTLPTLPKLFNALPTPPKPLNEIPTPPKPTNAVPTPPKPTNTLPTPPKPSNAVPTPPKPTNTLPTPPKPSTNPLPTAPKNIGIGAAMLKPANPLPTFPKPANPLPTLPKAANPLPTFPKPSFNNTPALPLPQLPPSSSPAKPALPSRKW